MRYFYTLCLTLLFLFFASYANAKDYDGFLPPVIKPVKVGVAIYINNVDYINEDNSTVKLTMTLYSRWQDPRLTFAPSDGDTVKIFSGVAASDFIKTIWHPYLDVLQREDVDNLQQYFLKIYSDGTVDSVKKIELNLDLNVDARKFPFDIQKSLISIIPFGYSKEQVQLYPMHQYEGLASDILISNWSIYGAYKSKIAHLHKTNENMTHSAYEFTLTFKRDSYSYVLQVLLPLLVISVMCFLMMYAPIDVGTIFQVLITIILAMIAFQWLVLGQVPSGLYLNYTEFIILISFMFCCAVMITLIVLEIIERKMSKASRSKIERRVRFSLGSVYVLLNLLAIYLFFIRI